MPILKRLVYMLVAIAIVSVGMMPADAMARALFAYPLEGQSLEQENKDRLVCHSWAVDQTGYSPSGVPQETKGWRGARQGAVLGGATGTIIGAIASGGTGALIGLGVGAGSGGLIGGIIGSGKQKRLDAQYDAYLRAAQTCMESKSYRVSR